MGSSILSPRKRSQGWCGDLSLRHWHWFDIWTRVRVPIFFCQGYFSERHIGFLTTKLFSVGAGRWGDCGRGCGRSQVSLLYSGAPVLMWREAALQPLFHWVMSSESAVFYTQQQKQDSRRFCGFNCGRNYSMCNMKGAVEQSCVRTGKELCWSSRVPSSPGIHTKGRKDMYFPEEKMRNAMTVSAGFRVEFLRCSD